VENRAPTCWSGRTPLPPIAIFAAAVADWRVANAGDQKIKKNAGAATPELSLTENPDILSNRRASQVGTAETGDRLCRRDRECRANAKAKLAKKGCDWILAK